MIILKSAIKFKKFTDGSKDSFAIEDAIRVC